MYKKIVFFTLVLLVSKVSLLGADYKASLPQMPVYSESKDKGVLVDLVKAMAKTSGNNISIKVMPFTASVYMAQKGKVDFHMPLMKNDHISKDKLPFLYSTQSIFDVNFVLYTKKGSGVTLKNVSTKNIETDRAHTNYFKFKINPTNSIAKSLQKVHEGEIDGFIFADFATDPFLKESGFKDIKRELYKVFESKIVLPKTPRGEEVDKMLTSAINKLKSTGEYDKIMGIISQPYNDWQP